MRKIFGILIIGAVLFAASGPAKASKTSIGSNAETCWWPLESMTCGFGSGGNGCVEANDNNVGCGYTMPDGNCCTVLIMPGDIQRAQLTGQDFVLAKGHGCRDTEEHYYRVPISQIRSSSSLLLR